MDGQNLIVTKKKSITMMKNISEEDRGRIELKKKITAGKAYYLAPYLEDASKLLKREVTKNDLISVEQTNAILNLNSFPKRQVTYSNTLRFDDKPTLMDEIRSHVMEWDTAYFFYLTKVECCGMVEIPSLSDFNWNFSFNDERHGMIYFLRKDKKERILLDFYEEFSEFYIDVEITRYLF